MRRQVQLAVLVLSTALALQARASSFDDKTRISRVCALKARISQAQPREQCFLYAELIHQMTEVSLQQYQAGEVDKAGDLLKEIQQIAHRMHLATSDNDSGSRMLRFSCAIPPSA